MSKNVTVRQPLRPNNTYLGSGINRETNNLLISDTNAPPMTTTIAIGFSAHVKSGDSPFGVCQKWIAHRHISAT